MQVVTLHALPFDGGMWANAPALGLDAPLTPTLYEFGDTITDWAEAVLDLAGPEPFVVIGNSVGGSCALEIARLAPDRVRAIGLIGTKAGHRPEPGLRDAAVRALTERGIDAAWNEFWAPLFGSATDPAVVEAALALARAVPIDDLVRGVRAFHGRADLSAVVRGWSKPIIVISGSEDRAPLPETAETAAAGARLGQFHLVPDIGHYVSLERPSAIREILFQVNW